MKKKSLGNSLGHSLGISVVTLLLSAAPTFACATCMAGKDSKTSTSLAIAVWVMIGAIGTVLGGVSAFGVHLWRHASIPLQPHEQLIDEDFAQYD